MGNNVLQGGLFSKWFLWAALVLLPALAAAIPRPEAGALAPIDPLFHQPLSRGITLVYADRFAESLALFDSLSQAHPRHPGPPFYKAAVYQTWMISYRFNGFAHELEASVQEAIEKAEILLAESDDPWLMFYSAGAYGYRAFYKFRRYNWLGAYRDSRKSLKHLKAGLSLEPNLYDAYLALGAYHYWSTAKSKVLRLLTFWMKDRRDQGLAELELAMAHSRYARQEARLVLVTALFDYGQYQRGLDVLELGAAPLEQQINSELYLRGRLLEKLDRHLEAQPVFQRLLVRLEAKEYAGLGYQIECKYRLARIKVKQNQLVAARALAAEALAMCDRRDGDKELESDLIGFDQIKAELEELHRELSEGGRY